MCPDPLFFQPIASCPCVLYHGHKPDSALLAPVPCCCRFPHDLPFSQLNKASSFSFFSHDKCFSPDHLGGPHLTWIQFANVSLALQGAQSLRNSSGYDVKCSEERGIINFLGCAPAPAALDSVGCLCCWFIFCLMALKDHQSLSHRAATQPCSPLIGGAWSALGAGLWICPYWIACSPLLAHPSSMPMSFGKAALPSSAASALPRVVVSWFGWDRFLLPSSWYSAMFGVRYEMNVDKPLMFSAIAK